MTELQKLMLDALDQLGSMTRHELEVACLVSPKARGGFAHSLNRLFKQKLVASDEYQLWVTKQGVWAIEKANMAAAQ